MGKLKAQVERILWSLDFTLNATTCYNLLQVDTQYF